MSSSSSTSISINNLLINSKYLFNIEKFNNPNIVVPSPTITIEDSIIEYSLELKVLFCNICSINLTYTNYIKHLSSKHSIKYKEYKENNTLEKIKNNINLKEFNSIKDLEEILEPNKYYFKDLPLLFNNYKCLECNFVNINLKSIRIHYNKEHINLNKTLKTKASYIIENIPLQLLEGFKNNYKIYFIPKPPSR